jgi:hypothetical protein
VSVGAVVSLGFAVSCAAAVGAVVSLGFTVFCAAAVDVTLFVWLVTVILQVSFVFPAFACTFAVPFFAPFTVADCFPFFFSVITFLPERIFQLTVFFVFFTVNVFVFPFCTVSVFALSLTAALADASVVGIVESSNASAQTPASSFFFIILFSFFIIL